MHRREYGPIYDKVSPNHISTMMSVFMEQAEAIGADELEYRLLARSEAENDFTAQLVSMRSIGLPTKTEILLRYYSSIVILF